jgi:hypothetical protein
LLETEALGVSWIVPAFDLALKLAAEGRMPAIGKAGVPPFLGK